MKKFLFVLPIFFASAAVADSGVFMNGRTYQMAAPASPASFVSENNYKYMQPYMTPRISQALSPATSGVAPRRVSARSAAPVARSASTTTAARAAAPTAQPVSGRKVSPRVRVSSSASSARAGTMPAGIAASVNSARAAAASARAATTPLQNTGIRVNAARGATTTNYTTSNSPDVGECLAEYNKCMDGYCHRPDTQYDKCYCSVRMAKIDNEFQPKIEDAKRRLIAVSIGGAEAVPDDVDDGLDFDWVGSANQMQGQQAFVMGNSICATKLAGCTAFSGQLTNLYRSEMNKDCTRYENYLDSMLMYLEQRIAMYQ